MALATHKATQAAEPYVPNFSITNHFTGTDVKIDKYKAADIQFRMVSRHTRHQAGWADSSRESVKITATPLDSSNPAIVKIENFMVANRAAGKFLLSDSKYQYVIRPSDSGTGPAIDVYPGAPAPSASTGRSDDICWNAESDVLTLTINSPTEISIPTLAPPGIALQGSAAAKPVQWSFGEHLESITFSGPDNRHS